MDNLQKRAIPGLVFLQVMIALMLFISAGSIRFWQGWLYWAMFSAAVVIITFYFLKHDPGLVERRIAVGPIAETAPIQKVIQSVTFVLFCAVLIVPGLDHRYGWSSVPVPLVLIADVFVALGFAIIFVVFQENSFAAATIRVEAEQHVISTGLYSHVRHPMYSGGLVMILATPLALGSLWGILPALALCAGIVVRLIDEEHRLSAELEGYDAYRHTVRHRLIPGIW